VIGIVLVSHGHVAEELLKAAQAIVGEIPAIAAVSIGWSDDVAIAHDAIAAAIHSVGDGDVLILTDMFGGTPTNVSLPFLSPKVEIVTGVNLPMLIKLSGLREGDLLEVARVLRDQGRGAIAVATEVLGRRPG
jgi:PTS system mannose-specific IIA component